MRRVALAILLLAGVSYGVPVPQVSVSFSEATSPQQVATTLQIVLLLTLLALAPAFLIMLTSFTRIVLVLGFLRRALGTQQIPPNQVLLGLALFLTIFTMMPVFQSINDNALKPYLAQEISQQEAFAKATAPLREFMLHQTRERDLGLFISISGMEKPKNPDDLPLYVIIPAFITSELKTAFQIGFVLFIPFLIIDMVVASVLMSMGMLMVPPVLVSLPFKIILFVLVDGWYLVMKGLALSFR